MSLERFISQAALAATCDPSSVPAAKRCEYVRSHSKACSAADGLLPLHLFQYCALGGNEIIIFSLAGMWMFVLLVLLTKAASDFFCPALEVISESLKLPPAVAGATLLALGNGAPDAFIQLAAVSSGQVGGHEGVVIALTEPVGGGLFVTNIVLGAVIMFGCRRGFVNVEGRVFLKDTLFYLISLLLVFWVILSKVAYRIHGALLLLAYIAYVMCTFMFQERADAVDTRDKHHTHVVHYLPHLVPQYVPDSPRSWPSSTCSSASPVHRGSPSHTGLLLPLVHNFHHAGDHTDHILLHLHEDDARHLRKSQHHPRGRRIACQHLSAHLALDTRRSHRPSSTHAVKSNSSPPSRSESPHPATHHQSATNPLLEPLLLHNASPLADSPIGHATSRKPSPTRGNDSPKGTTGAHLLHTQINSHHQTQINSNNPALEGNTNLPLLPSSPTTTKVQTKAMACEPVPNSTTITIASQPPSMVSTVHLSNGKAAVIENAVPLDVSIFLSNSAHSKVADSASALSSIGLQLNTGQDSTVIHTLEEVNAFPAALWTGMSVSSKGSSKDASRSVRAARSEGESSKVRYSKEGAERDHSIGQPGETLNAAAPAATLEGSANSKYPVSDHAPAGDVENTTEVLNSTDAIPLSIVLQAAGESEADASLLQLRKGEEAHCVPYGLDSINTNRECEEENRYHDHHQHPDESHHHHHNHHDSALKDCASCVWEYLCLPLDVLLSCAMPFVATGGDPPYSRWQAMFLPFTIPLLLVFSYDPSLLESRNPMLWGAYLGFAAATAAAVCLLWPVRTGPQGLLNMCLAVASFLLAAVWMQLGAGELIAVCSFLGAKLGISPSVLGSTVLAWGNALPDLVCNVTMAWEGFPTMALAATFASPMFILAVGVGAALLAGVWSDPANMAVVHCPVRMLYVAAIITTTLHILLASAVFRFRLGRPMAVMAWGFYAMFQMAYVSIIVPNSPFHSWCS